LTAYQLLYGFGSNRNGEIGRGNIENQFRPIQVSLQALEPNEYIVDIACGAGHTIALTNFDKVYGWGFNGYGQSGFPEGQNQTNPKKITAPEHNNLHF
jgi:alpha-tubulin suppressor-like RCC1 family protein